MMEEHDHHTYPRGRHLVKTVGDDHDEDDHNHVELTSAKSKDVFHDEDDYSHGSSLDSNGKQTQHEEQQGQDEYEHDHDHPSSAIGSKRTPWYGTAIILLSEVMGTGILSLPYAAKTLGWTTTIISIPLFAVFASYAGWLLAQVHVKSPQVLHLEFHSYADASTTLLGRTFGQITHISMLLNWGALAIYYLIATADGIGDIFEIDCSYHRAMLAVVILVIPCQCRDFYAISKYLSGPSTCSIILMVFVILGNLIFHRNDSEYGTEDSVTLGDYNSTTNTTIHGSTNSTDTINSTDTNNSEFVFGASTTIWPLPGTTLLEYLEAMSAFVFAYQGHAIFLELQAEMKDAREFPFACSIGYIIMCLMYAMTVLVAYGLRGDQTEEFLPDILPDGPARQLVGVLVCLHITVSYVIACQPLHMWLHATIFPQTFQQESRRGSWHWFLLTCGYLLFGFLIGNCVPFFADVQALIGSLFGAPSVFGWPVLFFVMLCRQQQLQQQAELQEQDQPNHVSNHHDSNMDSWWKTFQLMGGWHHVVVCAIFLFVLTPLFCILGTTGAIASIVQDAEHAPEPFQCNG